MSLNDYQKLAARSAKKFTNPTEEIMSWGLGIAGEAGDVASCIKKTYSHNNDQKEGIRENIGDTLWYAAMICNFYGWKYDEVLNENIAKLKKRYPKGFSLKNAKRKGKKIDWGEK